MTDDDCEAISGFNEWQGEGDYSEKTCPSAALSSTDPRKLNPGSNPVYRGEKPATGRLRYGTAPITSYSTISSNHEPLTTDSELR
jgi:hypothetical protein